MKIPRRMRTYCPHCRSHQEHELEKVRRGTSSGMTWGSRQQQRALKGVGNSGKFSRPPVGDKPTKKTNLKYICQDCGKAHLREGHRAGRVEFQQ